MGMGMGVLALAPAPAQEGNGREAGSICPSVNLSASWAGGPEGAAVRLDLVGIKPYGLGRDGSQRGQQQDHRRMFLLRPLSATRVIYI
jgi:hypothetical protein